MVTRKTLMELFGTLPDKVSPGAAIIEDVDYGAYWRKTIEYAVELDERIRAPVTFDSWQCWMSVI